VDCCHLVEDGVACRALPAADRSWLTRSVAIVTLFSTLYESSAAWDSALLRCSLRDGSRKSSYTKVGTFIKGVVAPSPPLLGTGYRYITRAGSYSLAPPLPPPAKLPYVPSAGMRLMAAVQVIAATNSLRPLSQTSVGPPPLLPSPPKHASLLATIIRSSSLLVQNCCSDRLAQSKPWLRWAIGTDYSLPALSLSPH
jgi:hypothetical protein